MSLTGIPETEMKQFLQQGTATMAAVAVTAGELQETIAELKSLVGQLRNGMDGFAAGWQVRPPSEGK